MRILLTDGDSVEGVPATTRLRVVALAVEVARGGAQAVDFGASVSTEALVAVLDQSPGGSELFAVCRAHLARKGQA